MNRLILFAVLALMVALPAVSAWSTSYTGVTYAAGTPSYYGQYQYGRVYSPTYGQPYYTGSRNLMPVMSTRCSGLFGCDSVQTGHMYIDSAVDYAYYSNPDLFAVRYMNNHQRSIRGLWPQSFVW